MRYIGVSRYAFLCGVAQLAVLASAASAQDQVSQGQAQQSQDVAAAQPATTSQGHPEGANADGGIQDIVVTANRQAQNLQKVSAAVQVVDGSKIRSQALTNVEQIFADTPSVQVTAQPAGFNVDIRGQGADRPASSSQGSVAVEFDGVYNIQSYATTLGFFDTDRIEVLPGPQSTRYGPNAKGGVVNIISKDPVLGSVAGQASLTVGDYGLIPGEAAQNIPLTDTLAIRIAGAAIHRNSYFKPATGNAIAQAARIKLLFQPNDRLTLKGEYEFNHIGGTGAGAEAGGPPFLAGLVSYYPNDSINNYGNPWRHGDYSTGCGTFPPDFFAAGATNSGTCQPYQTHSNLYQRTAIGSVGYRFTDWAALDVTQSYIEETGTQYDCKSENIQYVGELHDCYVEHPVDPFYSWSTEARLHNVAGNPVLWNLGFYHWNYHVETWTPQFFGSASQKSLAATATNALFGDVTVPVTSRFRLIAGARGSRDLRWYRSNQDTVTYRAKYPTHFDYRAGEEFDITPTSLEYFTVSSGYAPGSVGEGLRSDGTNGFYKNPNETLTAFELGSKNRFFDNRLQVNADVFWYIQKNYAFNNSYSNFSPACGFVAPGGQTALACQIPNSTANAHSLGLEGQVRFNVTRNDLLSANVSWLRARFDKKQHACNTAGLPAADLADGGCYIGTNNPDLSISTPDFTRVNGQVEDHSPVFQGSFSYTHTFRLGSGATFDIGGEAVHSSGYWEIDSYDTRDFFQPAYTQYNATASFTPAGASWSLSGFVRNISNYAIKVSVVPSTTISDPRTFGGTLSLKW